MADYRPAWGVSRQEVGEGCQELIMVGAGLWDGASRALGTGQAEAPPILLEKRYLRFQKKPQIVMMGKEAELCWTSFP